MAITEDTVNQPAPVGNTTSWSTTSAGYSTASFSPQAGTLVLALFSGNGDFGQTAQTLDGLTSTGTQPTKPWAGGSGWELRLRAGVFASGGANSVCSVWGGYFATAPGATVLTMKATNHNVAPGALLDVRCLLGAAASQAGATASLSPAVAAALQASIAAGTGSAVYGAAINYTANAALTALANTSILSTEADATNGSWEGQVKSTSATAGTATYGYSSSCTGGIVLVEIQPAAAAAAVPDVGMANRSYAYAY